MAERPRIVLSNDRTDALAQQLLVAFPTADFRVCNSYDALPSLIDSYHPHVVYSVRFDGTQGFPRDALFGSGGPAWVANGGAGTDHYGAWDPDRTTVTNTAGVAADMMAEYVFGGFLHFTLDVMGLQKDKAAKQWNSRTVAPLSGKTLLIVGLGHTGRAVASRAKAFGMTVWGTRANPTAMEHVDEVHAAGDLISLLPRADFIVVSTPLTAVTSGLIGPEAFGAMKRGVILADVSRGGVVDQSGLLDALRSGLVAGAALDVFETEPLPADNPLWELENVLISPHCSSVYEGWEAASFAMFLENLARWTKGAPLMNVVSPSRGY
ncbi:D-2-hydroxyacid dehydrogenase [Sulfitobacter aestuariivivens]|uniref:D-2-hydroxyacid dehydrogenase n=1 Tax=Sulfitobacter aestuariivivens TaxID=2766981 RepID=A0A927D3S2_9RHOB|nr:D-2-hydroxyacid dehydrogenase [Sulfitobacter aestuariivivens]MBD3664490.1 D-2-hydroxyacid dehydrogenase [Sulfitobacter aestuariivivens]